MTFRSFKVAVMAHTGVYVLPTWAEGPEQAAVCAYVCLALHGIQPFAHRTHDAEDSE